jgi:hypothetical protein
VARVAPAELDEVIAQVDLTRDEHLDADVAVAVGMEWEGPQGTPQLDLTHLIRRQMGSSDNHCVARVNRVGRERDRRLQRDDGAKTEHQ